MLGIRGDYYWFDVDADLAVNSGDDSDGIISPKGSLIYSFSEETEAYLSAGYGFHSNDARGTTITIDPGTLFWPGAPHRKWQRGVRWFDDGEPGSRLV